MVRRIIFWGTWLATACSVYASVSAAQAGTRVFTTIYEFSGLPGVEHPVGPLVSDKNGVLYGAGLGGQSRRKGSGPGTVFSLTPPGTAGGPWTETILHNFEGPGRRGGAYPNASLLIDENGDIYGTTTGGGEDFGSGAVFELKQASGGGAWEMIVLHTFYGGTDGAGPGGGLVRGPGGALYGTTYSGGGNFSENCSSYGCGTVFSLSPPTAPGMPWAETVLYRFTGINGDGGGPSGTLAIDANGALYGTCQGGGNGNGVIYQFLPPASPGGDWTEKILHSFTVVDGTLTGPGFGVIIGGDGALYGTNQVGGGSDGNIFQLTPPVSPSDPWSETTLYTFDKRAGEVEGGVVMGSRGQLYGTTASGGTHLGEGGTIFELKPPTTLGGAWQRVLLYTFPQVKVGGDEPSTLLIGNDGALYGVTYNGGIGPCTEYGGRPVVGCGTVFKLQP